MHHPPCCFPPLPPRPPVLPWQLLGPRVPDPPGHPHPLLAVPVPHWLSSSPHCSCPFAALLRTWLSPSIQILAKSTFTASSFGTTLAIQGHFQAGPPLVPTVPPWAPRPQPLLPHRRKGPCCGACTGNAGHDSEQGSVAWHGAARLGTAWHGVAQRGTGQHGMARGCMAWHGMAWDGMGWYGMARGSMAWHGAARHSLARVSTARNGAAELGSTQHGSARLSSARDRLRRSAGGSCYRCGSLGPVSHPELFASRAVPGRAEPSRAVPGRVPAAP